MANAGHCAVGMRRDALPSYLLLSPVFEDGEQFFVTTFRILVGLTQPIPHQYGKLRDLILCVVFEKK
jgi:hypothetical protein